MKEDQEPTRNEDKGDCSNNLKKKKLNVNENLKKLDLSERK